MTEVPDATTFVVEIDEAELAVVMCEAVYGVLRPTNMTVREALDDMDADCRDGWIRAARAAIVLMAQYIAKAGAEVEHREISQERGRMQ